MIWSLLEINGGKLCPSLQGLSDEEHVRTRCQGSFGKAPVSIEGSPTRYPVHYAIKPAASGQTKASRKGAGRVTIQAKLPTCFSQKYSSMRRLCSPKSNLLLGFQKSIENLAFLLFHQTEGSSC